jgi:hypothetical protein
MQPKRSESFEAIRFETNPVIHRGMPGLEGEAGANINGPSLIRAPGWIERPLGRYYLYFAHHGGEYIRLAYADDLAGPWTVHPPGTLHAKDAPGRGHIASPDVHVDPARGEIRMYFHRSPPAGSPVRGQVSFVALSKDGLRFDACPDVLGPFYFRVFRHGGWHYAFAKNDNADSVVCRSRDGLVRFEEGPNRLPGSRHTAMWVEGETLHLLYSMAGDRPERILLSTLDLAEDWTRWQPSPPEVVLEPETDYEGAGLPLMESSYGAAKGPVRQLRDPAVFEDDGERYLLYSVAGEQGIAIARLRRRGGDEPGEGSAR